MLSEDDWKFCLTIMGIPTLLLAVLEIRLALLVYCGI